ncbi:MAG TPA: DUF1307 domain-containing protein [Candidatus Pelethocola excrementipullorum]|nr:DUF1307 domain-containing protein [Candidatus Pelethocola excrementipullorum]
MKRFAKSLVVGMLLVCTTLAMVGCGAKKQTATCTIEQDGMKIEMVLDAEGDKIMKLTQTSTVSLEGVAEEQVAALDENIAQIKEQYEAIDGVKYNFEKSDKELKEIVEIDTSNKDTLKAAIESELLPVEGNQSSLSLKATKESMADLGWTVK